MKVDKEKLAFKTIVGGKHIITDDVWALSLVRRLGKEHAFLLLEGVLEGIHIAKKIELKSKEGSNNTKADIVYDDMSVAELIKFGANCDAITWGNFDRQQRVLLQELIQAEMLRGKAGLINYVMMGDSKITGSVASSLQASGSDASHNASQVSIQEKRENIAKQLALMPEKSMGSWRLLASHISVESADMLLRYGHNCCSWSVEVVKAIGLEYNESYFVKLVVRNPTRIEGNSKGEDLDETSSRCVIF